MVTTTIKSKQKNESSSSYAKRVTNAIKNKQKKSNDSKSSSHKSHSSHSSSNNNNSNNQSSIINKIKENPDNYRHATSYLNGKITSQYRDKNTGKLIYSENIGSYSGKTDIYKKGLGVTKHFNNPTSNIKNGYYDKITQGTKQNFTNTNQMTYDQRQSAYVYHADGNKTTKRDYDKIKNLDNKNYEKYIELDGNYKIRNQLANKINNYNQKVYNKKLDEYNQIIKNQKNEKLNQNYKNFKQRASDKLLGINNDPYKNLTYTELDKLRNQDINSMIFKHTPFDDYIEYRHKLDEYNNKQKINELNNQQKNKNNYKYIPTIQANTFKSEFDENIENAKTKFGKNFYKTEKYLNKLIYDYKDIPQKHDFKYNPKTKEFEYQNPYDKEFWKNTKINLKNQGKMFAYGGALSLINLGKFGKQVFKQSPIKTAKDVVIGSVTYPYQMYKQVKAKNANPYAIGGQLVTDYAVAKNLGSIGKTIPKNFNKLTGKYVPNVLITSNFPRMIRSQQLKYLKNQAKDIKVISSATGKGAGKNLYIGEPKYAKANVGKGYFAVPKFFKEKAYKVGDFALNPYRNPSYWKVNVLKYLNKIKKFDKPKNIGKGIWKSKILPLKDWTFKNKDITLQTEKINLNKYNKIKSNKIQSVIPPKSLLKKYLNQPEKEIFNKIEPENFNKNYIKQYIGRNRDGIKVYKNILKPKNFKQKILNKWNTKLENYKNTFNEKKLIAQDIANTGRYKWELLKQNKLPEYVIDNSGAFHINTIKKIGRNLKTKNKNLLDAFADVHDIYKQPIYNINIAKNIKYGIKKGYYDYIPSVKKLTNKQKNKLAKLVEIDEKPPLNLNNIIYRTNDTFKYLFKKLSNEDKKIINSDRLARFGKNADPNMIFKIKNKSLINNLKLKFKNINDNF